MEQLSPRQRELHDKLANLLREYADVVGPVKDDIMEPIDAALMDEMEHISNAALSEWIICMSWVDMDTGSYFTTKMNQHGMPHHHQLGLLAHWEDQLL